MQKVTAQTYVGNLHKVFVETDVVSILNTNGNFATLNTQLMVAQFTFLIQICYNQMMIHLKKRGDK
jgi:hypothetical protein